MNTKHTPGPWIVVAEQDGHAIEMGTAINENPYEPQHRIEYHHGCRDGDQYEEAEANIVLMSFAPKMLNELIRLRNAIRFSLPIPQASTDAILTSLINEATGNNN